ncbi:MAG: Transcriptional regulator CtsR [Firmicutes bacterium ADurb.Bin193]|nr:MAG: Transcriptional regulator CtsR [Firmicutes bacterium ADurb.Bin193]
MKISEVIEQFIKNMLMQADGATIDLQRNELANQLGCVPSQINYVISKRFTTEHGYLVESRRGGGGYIRITKMPLSKAGYIMHIVNSIGSSVTAGEAAVFVGNCGENGIMTPREEGIILSAVGDSSLLNIEQPHRDILRAKILKNMLLNLG